MCVYFEDKEINKLRIAYEKKESIKYGDQKLLNFLIRSIDEFFEFFKNRMLKDGPLKYQSLPHEGYQILGKLCVSQDDFDQIISNIFGLMDRDDIFCLQHDKLLAPVIDKVGDNEKRFLVVFIETHLKNYIDECIKLLSVLPLNKKYEDIFLEVFKAGDNLPSKKLEELKKLAFSKTFVEHYSTYLGQESPQHKEIIEIFRRFSEDIQSTYLNLVFQECIKKVQKEVASMLKDHAEILDEK